MSPLSPRDVRIQTIYEVGVKVDDVLEVARLETARKEGAHGSLLQATQTLAAVLKQVDAEVSPEHAELAKAWVRRCYAACNNLLANASGLMFAARGSENQAKNFVGMVKQIHDLEMIRKQREETPVPAPELVDSTVEAPKEPVRPAHVPGRTLKEQRLAAAKAEEEAKAAQKKEEAPAPVKRRGRPPKNTR